MVDVDEILKVIPESLSTSLHKGLIDVILKSKNAPNLPAGVANHLLGLYRDDQLATQEGLKTLLDASIILEREKTAEKLHAMGLTEASKRVRGE
jgi:hypothetical protein